MARGRLRRADYGFFSPRRRATLETVKALFGAAMAEEQRASGCVVTETPRILHCPKCGSPLVFVREIVATPMAMQNATNPGFHT